MRRENTRHQGLGGSFTALAAVAAVAMAAAGCGGSEPAPSTEQGTAPTDNGPSFTPAPGAPGSSAEEPAGPVGVLSQRRVDYGEALRTASLKLVGALPTATQILAVAGAPDEAKKRAVYEAELDKLLADTRFTTRMVQWWRDTLKTGGSAAADTAAIFAAQVVVQDRSYMELFTGQTGLCPTMAADGTITAADCDATTPKAGLLGNPGLMAQYYANMAFRRVRFVQETFACTKFPAEYAKTPVPMGASLYTSPWDFQTISGGQGARVDFKDTSSVICANCHTTMNHLAPLFGNFDENGAYNATAIQVETPIVTTVAAERVTRLTDWLPAGQKTSWRNGVEAADLPALGQAMSKDPEVARCAVNRVWNWALSRGDIVNDLATIPSNVTDPLMTEFQNSGFKMKRIIRQAFLADDFVKF